MNKIMIVSPHADDETLGCGGFMSCHQNSEYTILLMSSRDIYFKHSGITVKSMDRALEMADAVKSLIGSNPIEIFEAGIGKETFLDTLPIGEIVDWLDKKINDFKPDCMLIPYPSFHQDHWVIQKACLSALRPGSHIPSFSGMYEYPHVLWSGDSPAGAKFYQPMSDDVIEKKLAALRFHKSQLRSDQNHALSEDSVRLLASLRGKESGSKYAEAFYPIKGIFCSNRKGAQRVC